MVTSTQLTQAAPRDPTLMAQQGWVGHTPIDDLSVPWGDCGQVGPNGLKQPQQSGNGALVNPRSQNGREDEATPARLPEPGSPRYEHASVSVATAHTEGSSGEPPACRPSVWQARNRPATATRSGPSTEWRRGRWHPCHVTDVRCGSAYEPARKGLIQLTRFTCGPTPATHTGLEPAASPPDLWRIGLRRQGDGARWQRS